MWRNPLRQNLNVDLVEAGHAVRLGPERDASGRTERAIGRGMERLSVERDGELVAFGPKAKRVPRAGSHLDVRGCQLLAATLHDAVETDIVLQRVRAREVVVVRRRHAHRNPASLIDLSGHWLEAELDV